MKTLCSSSTREWVLRNPSGQEMILRLEPGQSVTVGRDLTSDLPILDAGVSRHHATICFEKETSGEELLWVEDLHSHNGTFVNTERVQRSRIQPGDIITCGRSPLTLTERQAAEEALDPLGRLSQDKLTLLLRVAREFAAEPEQAMIFQRLLELAVEALQAERGAVLLWEEKRNVFHPVAASPRDLFQDVSRLITRRIGETILRGAKARLLWPEITQAGFRVDLAQSTMAPAASAIATPLLAGTKALGILYLDRAAAQRSFQAKDVDFLYALAWVANTALGTSTQLSDMRDWNQRLESLISQRALEEQKAETDTKSVPKPVEGIAKLLGDLEGYLREAGDAAQSAGPTERAAAVVHGALRAAALRTKAVRCLCERQSARLEEVQVAHACREAAQKRCQRTGCHGDAARGDLSPDELCRVEQGGELSVICPPDDLYLTLELALDFLIGEDWSHEGLADPISAVATSAQDGSLVHLRLSRPQAAPRPRAAGADAESPKGGNGARAGEDTKAVDVARADTPKVDSAKATDSLNRPSEAFKAGRAMSLRLVRRTVRERLRGDLEVGSEGSWLELRLPQAALSLGETAVFPATRFYPLGLNAAVPESGGRN